MDVKVGLKGYAETTVTKDKTAMAFGSGLFEVFSTPYMAGLMEVAANSSIKPHLDEGKDTVGTRLDIVHVSATPVGMKVWVESTVTAVGEKTIDFEVKAYDEKGLIGEGVHTRAVITPERFMARCLAKLN